MKVSGKTDIGRVRRTNQDSYAVGFDESGCAWAVVCDGMGGANGGNVASGMAVDILSQSIKNKFSAEMSSEDIDALLTTAVKNANLQIYNQSVAKEEYSGMGTTVVVVLVAGQTAHIVHAGDSRAYLCAGNTITQLTKDHSIVQNMVESGQLTKDEAEHHPRKNMITRALGVEATVIADYSQVPIKSGQTIVICTDGLSNFVSEAEILEAVNRNSAEEVADKLISLANTNGGGDNITVVVISK